MKCSVVYTEEPTAVIYLQGKKYKVTIDVTYSEDPAGMPEYASVSITPTEEPLTINKSVNGYYKFGGSPHFIQNEFHPADDDGFPYCYICTLNNEWGDCGNGNIFALIKNDQVLDVFVEASCH